MNQLAIRNAIVGYVQPAFSIAYPAIAIVHDNSPFDWNSPPPEFVQFEVKFIDGNQVGMAADPKTRYTGFVYVTTFARSGTGSQRTLAILDFFADLLKFAYVGPVQFHEPKPGGSTTVKTYYTEQLKVGFLSKPA